MKNIINKREKKQIKKFFEEVKYFNQTVNITYKF
jgi:hypothetical protein